MLLCLRPAVEETTKVGECSFNNSNKPGRVDNECKATLDQVALLIQKEPNDNYVIVGYAEDDEKPQMTQLAGQRAVNVKYYLTQGEGGQQINPSLLQVKAGAEKTKAIRIYRVPNGAALRSRPQPWTRPRCKGSLVMLRQRSTTRKQLQQLQRRRPHNRSQHT